MSINTRNEQHAAPQSRAFSLPAGQSEASRGAWRERKQTRQGKRVHREARLTKSQEDMFETNVSETHTFEADASQAKEAQKKAKKEVSKRRCWKGPT